MSGSKSKVSDRELMLFVDGELDPARRTDVQSQLRTDSVARRKVAALRLSGELVRDRSAFASSAAMADGIADAVMARIAAGDVPEASVGDGAKASDSAKVAPLPGPVLVGTHTPGPSETASRPANDNARRIYFLAAAAVAAAAALMVWGKVDSNSGEGPTSVAAQATSPAEVATAPSETAAPQRDEPSPDGELDVGVEVAAVDFGARQGSIFYVPNGAAEAHTTTVVWLADNSGGDE